MKKDAPRKGASFFIWREGSIRPPQYGPALFDDHGAVGLLVVLVNIGCVALAFVGQLFGVHAAFYEEVVNALGAVLGNALVACRRTRLLVGVALDLVDPVFRTALDQVGHQFEAGLLLRRQLRHAVIVENDRSRAEGVHLLCGSGLGGGHDEREQTLNQLLVEMDGFTNNEGVIVMAATNRADILDNALLRPGRFDRRVYMGLPDIKGREEILKVHARGKPLGDDVDLKSIARGTAGFAGADLENLLNEAAIMATRGKRRFIMQADIDEAILKVVMGPEKKSRVVSERARRLTAYHESGHAIASFFLKNADPVHYITIIPRGAAGGFTWYRKAEDAEDFTSRGEMFDSIVSALGGRIAEQLFLEDISTGASGDIQQATNIARDMVMKYGMSEKLGPISFDDSSHSIFIGRDFGTTKSYSEETAATIDEEVKHIFDQAYAKCEALLREHADLLTGLAEYLLIHETIEGDDFRYYCEHGVMPVHPDDTIEPPAKVIRRMDEAPVAPQPDTEAPAQPTDVDTPEAGSDKTE